MNLRRLTVFVRVVDAGSFSAAARSLGVPKSAVSESVAGLEAELGVRLLNRSSRATTVTEAGAALHRKAAPALRTLDEAATEASDTHGALRGTVRLTASVEVGARLLEPTISRFMVDNPEVRVDVVLTSQVLDLAAHNIDLAVRGGPVRDESLVARRLSTEQAGLFASPSYLRARGTPKRVSELAQHDCIVSGGAEGRGRWRLGEKGDARTVEVTARLAVDSYGYALRAAESGVGIALLPLFLVEAEVRRGALVRVLPAQRPRDIALWLVYPARRYLARSVVALRDALLAGSEAARR